MAMAVNFTSLAFQYSAVFSAPVGCSDAILFTGNLSYDAGCRTRTAIRVIDTSRIPRARAGQTAGPLFLSGIRNSAKQHYHKIVAQGGRALQYEDVQSYVLMEPGQEEQFVTLEELQAKLKSWLVKWPASKLPDDLTPFENLDAAVTHLVDSACELDLGGGRGSIQWFQVRLES